MRILSYENEFCMQFHFHANQKHFYKNGFALRLVLKRRHKGIGNGLLINMTRAWEKEKSESPRRNRTHDLLNTGREAMGSIPVGDSDIFLSELKIHHLYSLITTQRALLLLSLLFLSLPDCAAAAKLVLLGLLLFV